MCERGQHAQEGCFPGPVGPNNDPALLGVDIPRDVTQDWPLVAHEVHVGEGGDHGHIAQAYSTLMPGFGWFPSATLEL